MLDIIIVSEIFVRCELFKGCYAVDKKESHTMKKSKKFIAVLLCSGLALSAVACESDPDTNGI